MGVNPQVWGAYVWAAVHLCCMGAPDALDAAHIDAYTRFFYGLPDVLPCGACSQHFRETLAAHPLTADAVKTRTDLEAYAVTLHNAVSARLGKEQWSFERAKAHWARVARGECRAFAACNRCRRTPIATGVTIALAACAGAAVAFAILKFKTTKKR